MNVQAPASLVDTDFSYLREIARYFQITVYFNKTPEQKLYIFQKVN
jgi:hypothetical protein